MNVKRRSLAERETTTRNVLIGTAVVGALGTLYLLTRGSSAQAAQRNLALGAPGTLGDASGGACDSYLSAGQTDFQNGLGGSAVGNDLANFGVCAGTNALLNDVMDSGAAASIEAAIEQGTFQAAEITGLATSVLGVAGTLGVGVGAATAVMPIAGVALAAALSIVDFINSLGPGPQIYVPNPNASGSDAISFQGTQYEKINFSDYYGFIDKAQQWINDNPQAALTATPQWLSDQYSIFLNQNVPGQLASTVLALIAGIGTNVYSQLASKNAPGAVELLRTVQLPAAAAVCAAMPNKLGYLAGFDWLGRQITSSLAPLQTQFPALSSADMGSIYQSLSGQYQAAISKAVNYVNQQCPPLTSLSALAPYKLSPTDACNILAAWMNPSCPGSQAPVCQPGPCTNISIPGPGGNVNACIPGPPIVMPPGTIVVGGGIDTSGLTVASSAAGTVAKSAAVVAGAAGAALLVYKLYTGYSFLKTAQGAWSDAKKGASYLKGKLTGRKSNPISVSPYRTSATGGRIVAYRVRLFSRHEEILFNGQRAALIRHGKKVASFKPSSFQKTKIRSGRGEVLIFQDQLEG
jgi:hypothetical protein